MKIGIIGIGAIGGTLAARWSGQGHAVSVANSRGEAAVREFADRIGAVPADIRGAAEDADVVLLSIPFPAVATLPGGLFDRAADGVVIIDTGNYYPDVRDARIPEIDAGMPESVWASRQLGRPIFKAFNSILSHSLAALGKPEGASGRLAIPVAGDDARGKDIVMGLVNQTGFDPVDGGTLAESWRQQPLTPAYCCDYGEAKMRQGINTAVRGEAEKIRDTDWREKYGRLFGDKPVAGADRHAEVIALNRSFNPL
jgi:predicted dinucleotide-binding enzyme